MLHCLKYFFFLFSACRREWRAVIRGADWGAHPDGHRCATGRPWARKRSSSRRSDGWRQWTVMILWQTRSGNEAKITAQLDGLWSFAWLLELCSMLKDRYTKAAWSKDERTSLTHSHQVDLLYKQKNMYGLLIYIVVHTYYIAASDQTQAPLMPSVQHIIHFVWCKGFRSIVVITYLKKTLNIWLSSVLQNIFHRCVSVSAQRLHRI